VLDVICSSILLVCMIRLIHAIIIMLYYWLFRIKSYGKFLIYSTLLTLPETFTCFSVVMLFGLYIPVGGLKLVVVGIVLVVSWTPELLFFSLLGFLKLFDARHLLFRYF
jgi:hypothetical protein